MPTVGSNPTPSATCHEETEAMSPTDRSELVVVTGVAGFIGAAVARRLVAEGFRVAGVDDLSSGRRSQIPTEVDLIEADLALGDSMRRLPTKALAVLHLAGQSSGEISFDDPVGDLEKNTVSTLRLVDYARQVRVARFVYASSMSVYGKVQDAPISEATLTEPLTCYGIGKLASESYLRVFSHHLPSVSLRMFNVYGPGQDLDNLRQGMISIYLAQAHRTQRIIVKGDPERFRDFVYIDDVVEAWFRCTTLDQIPVSIINVGSGVRTTVREVLHEISRLVPGVTVEFTTGTPGDQFGIYSDSTRMRQVLGIRATTPLDEGLRMFSQTITKP